MKGWLAVSLLLILVMAGVQDATQGIFTNIPVGRSWPRAVGVDPSRNEVYVTTFAGLYPPSGFTFTVLSSLNSSISAVVPFNGIPGDIAVNSITGKVYVVNGSSVEVFDARTRQFTSEIKLRAPLYSIAVDSTSNRIYVGSADKLWALAPNGTALGGVGVGSYPEGVAVDTSKHLIFVSNFDSASVTVVNASNLEVVTTLPLGDTRYTPSELVVDAALGEVFVTTGRNRLVVLNEQPPQVVATVQVGDAPANGTGAVGLDSRGSLLYVASPPSPTIWFVSEKSLQVVGSVVLPYVPYEIGVNPESGRAYVTNYHFVASIAGPTGSSPSSYALFAAVVVGIVLSGGAVFFALRQRGRPVMASQTRGYSHR
jgi:DNA-binding beta-propeller fold protein YncE